MMREKCIFFLIVAALCCAEVYGADLLIQNARLIDGTGAPPQENVSILVRDGWITAIGDNASADDVPTLDAAGGTVLPGLIDSHVHLFWGPGGYRYDFAELTDENGSFDMETWRETLGKNLDHYLRAYLACGVTTILDAGGPAGVVTEVRGRLAAGVAGPRFLPLGPFTITPGGYGDSGWIDPLSSIEDVQKHFNTLQELEVFGAKVMLERGWNPYGEWPLHPPEIREAIADAAAGRNLPVFIHVTSEPDMRIALEMAPRALMHTLISRDEELSDDYVALMARTDTCQVTTFTIMDSELTFYQPERLDNPFLDVVVPADELAAARDPRTRWEAQKAKIGYYSPGIPKIFWGLLTLPRLFSEQLYIDWLQISRNSVGRLHDAGVTVVMGSDTPYTATALYAFHGPTTFREIELLGQAGLTNMEALEAATRVPAEMLGLDDEIGTVESGKRADLVILADDPLEDLGALWSIQYTVQDGVARTPQGWMEND